MLTTVGLEVHVQLDSKTKIFCGCRIQFGGAPNSRTCPVCLGLPGALPVLNRRVFDLGLRAVLALSGTISKKIKFDRKNYYYPDLPKGYQISQWDCPLGRGGFVELDSGKKIRLNRAHLEEDAGKLIHDQSPDTSLVDLNRAGTPLLEIVTEPDLENPAEAYEYLSHLKTILKAVGVSECDMEKGQLRCDANVSVRNAASDPLGKRVEIKNLNSFKAVKAALEFEVTRQTEAFEKGVALTQETRLWDDKLQKTFSMRSKEEANDYRYFPEPDLVPFTVSEEEIKTARAEFSKWELPRQKKERFAKQYGLSDYDACLLSGQDDVALFFEETVKLSKNAKAAANWIIGPVFAYLGSKGVTLNQTKLTANHLSKIYQLVEKGRMSFQAAKDNVFAEVIANGLDPETVMKEKHLEQVSEDGALIEWIAEVMQANPKVVDDFRSGKPSAAQFLVGQVMKKSKGKANPGKAKDLLLIKLKEI
ncbi:MAG: Asp-tRNA(Asn)/Glu-tRNA(Gln) amidotransferase GatCAB subunit B [Candidatus Omnitrophica bacterium CG07_land_8_20_14_0_80_50_8]|nr:MAG: glutaminyl-tRNA synthase (glutamine-hydrolyzing) subunit B [Candidatus Omnitrophica bacterium CG1_02_49_16]PIU40715.1 MAG: Asp-tRNA(Asn)/Glu-tRNA(Gln) amidotransferase GatCAB subunit B [Candidatus Omnitrophica bacterium CG07_land_8_20_14_0_80_50_8]